MRKMTFLANVMFLTFFEVTKFLESVQETFMFNNINEKKLLSPQQVVFRKPADYKL